MLKRGMSSSRGTSQRGAWIMWPTKRYATCAKDIAPTCEAPRQPRLLGGLSPAS